jgi:hypothetical protein
MDEIFFPAQYKKAILQKTKNTTIRFGKEIGKYSAGKVYLAKSYAGNNWGIKIKINSVIKITLNQLSDHGIPERSIAAIQRKENICPNESVEVIRFTIT